MRDLVASTGIGFGDMAICTATNRVADDTKRLLGEHEIPCQVLQEYEGVQSDSVKVGTLFQSEGSSSSRWCSPGLTDGEFPRPRTVGQDEREYEEQRALDVSRLFVAMTRARDGLFLTCTNHPSPILTPALGLLEVIDA